MLAMIKIIICIFLSSLDKIILQLLFYLCIPKILQ